MNEVLVGLYQLGRVESPAKTSPLEKRGGIIRGSLKHRTAQVCVIMSGDCAHGALSHM